MTEERKREIALLLLKYYTASQGIFLSSLGRNLGNAAKATGIPLDELKQFTKELIVEVTDEKLK